MSSDVPEVGTVTKRGEEALGTMTCLSEEVPVDDLLKVVGLYQERFLEDVSDMEVKKRRETYGRRLAISDVNITNYPKTGSDTHHLVVTTQD